MTRRKRGGWKPEARAGSLESRRTAQAEHDAAALAVIRESRAAGLSWRKTARALARAGIPPPRYAKQWRTPGGEYHGELVAVWDHSQVIRIARRAGIE